MLRSSDAPERRRRVAAWALAGWLCACQPSGEPGAARPNVVLVSIDTLRADRINAYGYTERVLTPAMDALAADGILFERCSAASAWTTPAHASLFTARFPSAHGLTQSLARSRRQIDEGETFHRLAASQTTLAEVLRDAGYATAAFTGGVTLDPVLGLDQGFERYETTMFKLNRWNMGELETWLDDVAGGPFFLFWHTFEVHTPFLDGRFLGEVLDARRASALSTSIEALATRFQGSADFGISADLHVDLQRASLAGEGAMTREVSDALYCGGIASVDRWMGELVALLRERGLYERTLLVLTSDHGEEFGEHDERMFYHSHGHQLYEELVHVPLIVKLPGQERAGRRVSAIASTVDVMPTILDALALGEALPRGVQGVTLRPFWETASEQGLRPVTIESLVGSHEKKALREGDFKYIVSIQARDVKRHGRRHIPEQVARELYDLANDPFERENLLAGEVEPRHLRMARALEAKLRASVAAGDGEVEPVSVDAELLRGLEALGYGGGEGEAGGPGDPGDPGDPGQGDQR